MILYPALLFFSVNIRDSGGQNFLDPLYLPCIDSEFACFEIICHILIPNSLVGKPYSMCGFRVRLFRNEIQCTDSEFLCSETRCNVLISSWFVLHSFGNTSALPNKSSVTQNLFTELFPLPQLDDE
jgi:hypothetical protein